MKSKPKTIMKVKFQMPDDWQTEFPKEEGKYWFYGYRHGKMGIMKKENKPELMYVEVRKISKGFLYVASGRIMFESEVECPHFKKIDLPELPNL